MEWTDDLDFGHPVIDLQHQEIAALTDSLRELFKTDEDAPDLILALTEYCRLISNHFALEGGLMVRLPQKKYGGHIAAHAVRHSEMIKFVSRAIEDLSSGKATTEVVAAMPIVFGKLHHNIIFDDAELSRLLIAEGILAPGK